GRPHSMLSAMERICQRLTLGSVSRLPPVADDQRRAVCSEFGSSLNHATGCFISYSTKDEEFAEKLRQDLERAGFECWLASHDMAIGAKIRSAIDEAMRTRENVVLILSESSIASAWVEKEVETAFENEKLVARALLFPIRLDATVLKTEQAWAAD